tara:strand:+ start:75 stop:368 length:294 start_codon:yes stop_codon:yes gene_type:complete
MKLTKSKLKQIIQEELQAVLSEGTISLTEDDARAKGYQVAKKLCEKGYKAACHALEWRKKCEEELMDDWDALTKPTCQKWKKLRKSYEDQQYGVSDD